MHAVHELHESVLEQFRPVSRWVDLRARNTHLRLGTDSPQRHYDVLTPSAGRLMMA